MSATMAATLYQQYFGVPEPPIHVGARRFPIKEYYMEDLIKKFSFPAADMKAAKAIVNDCDRTNCMSPPSNRYMENLFRLTVRMVMCVGRPGSSILVFVTGMNDIISISDLIGLLCAFIMYCLYQSRLGLMNTHTIRSVLFAFRIFRETVRTRDSIHLLSNS
jgi:HrpA-like RNA helicase